MPIKYKEDTIVKNRQTGKITTQRFFIHTLSTPSLWEEFEKCRTPKKKVKFRNELVKRGFSNQEISEYQPS